MTTNSPLLTPSKASEATIYLLRHGEVTPKGLLCGVTDIALSETGLKQLKQATKSLPAIDRCYSSPLSRCLDFATLFTKNRSNSQHIAPRLMVEKDLQEMNFGEWDGQAYSALWQASALQHNLGDFWQNPWQVTPPNGEPMANFSTRIDTVWQQIIKQSQGKNVLVVTHAGVIKKIVSAVLGISTPTSEQLANLSVGYASLVKVNVCYDENNIWTSIGF